MACRRTLRGRQPVLVTYSFCGLIPTLLNPLPCLLAQGFVHSQLRQRTGAMLEVLERASFAAQEQKARKTSSGRTFVEEAAARTA